MIVLEIIIYFYSFAGTFISIDIQPEPPLLISQRAFITCTVTGSLTPVIWTTTARSANLSNQQAFVTSYSVRVSELLLNRVDSGYCGLYTCVLPNSNMNASVYVTVGKFIDAIP